VRVGDAVRIVGAVVRRPSLWRTGLSQWRRTTPPGWWRRRPFLPAPSGDYLRFRLTTQYGDHNHRVDPEDVMNYLAWCRAQRHVR
jgi:hypothetical protein